jgi:hypothetical protein
LYLIAPLGPWKPVSANACTVVQIDSANPKGQIEVAVGHTAGICPGSAGDLDDRTRGHDPKVGARNAQGGVLASVKFGEGAQAGVLSDIDGFVGDGIGVVRCAPYLLEAGVVGSGGIDAPIDAAIGPLGAVAGIVGI